MNELGWERGYTESGKFIAAVGDEGFDVGVLRGGFLDVVWCSRYVCYKILLVRCL